MECYGKQGLVRNRAWERASIIDNLMNATRLGGKIDSRTLGNVTVSRVREIRGVMVMVKINTEKQK